MPRVVASLARWKRLAPPRSRLPFPRPVSAAITDAFARLGLIHAARAAVVFFFAALYLRPSEALCIRK
eukprot:8715745-Lingulodinium_polyedra.AAC.1